MKKIHRRTRARALAVALAMGTVVAAAGTTNAVADAGTTLDLAVTPPGGFGLNLNGAPDPMTLTLDAPPAKDTYLKLLFSGTDSSPYRLNVAVTGPDGTQLPLQTDSSGNEVALIGADDTDGNGIPGTVMSSGRFDLGLQVLSPTGGEVQVTASLIDGATHGPIPTSGTHSANIGIARPSLLDEWGPQSGDPQWLDSGDVVLHGGGTLPLEYYAGVDNVMSVPVTDGHVELVVPAASLDAAGLTAAGLVGKLHASFSTTDSAPKSPLTWTAEPDGSLRLTSPAQDLLAPSGGSEPNEYFTFWLTADAGVPAVSLPFQTHVTDAQGELLMSGSQTLRLVPDPDHDVDWDGRADLMVRDKSGHLYLYRGTGKASAPFTARVAVPTLNEDTDETGYTYYGTDTRTGRPLLAARCTLENCGNGLSTFQPVFPRSDQPVPELYDYYQSAAWKYYTLQTGAGDITGDGNGDLLSRDSSGVLWISPGNGGPDYNAFHARVEVGSGWNQFNLLQGAGDVTGDGRPDLLARDSSGVLWLYQGTGKSASPYLPRTRIGSGWGQFNALVAVGDVTGDGHADLLARDTSGVLWLYQGTGKSTSPYLPRTRIGSGWGQFSELF